jgi:hypothetical protein
LANRKTADAISLHVRDDAAVCRALPGYHVALLGQGLIRQSEFRTVAGTSANYVKRISGFFSLLAGFDYNREAPRRDDLDHYGLFDPANFARP